MAVYSDRASDAHAPDDGANPAACGDTPGFAATPRQAEGATPIARHGIVNPSLGERHFDLRRYPVPSTLARWVDWIWTIHWDLRAGAFTQEVLPHPCVNLVVEETVAAVHGVGTRMFRRELVGAGRVLGIKFKPGAFSAFFDRPMVTLTDTSLGLGEAYGDRGSGFADAIRATDLGADAHALCHDFLREHFRKPDALADFAIRGAAHAQASPHVNRVEQLADHLAISVRTLQRAFRLHVGVSPNWVIRRFRIHEAAERARRGEPMEWSRLAHELGYFDQAHFSHDFKAQMGRSPARYAAECRAAPQHP